MEIIKLSRQLGEALRNSEEFKKYQQAKELCRQDSALEEKINEFKVQKRIFDTENQRENHDEDMLGVIKQRMDTLYEEINSTEIMKQFNVAEENFNILLNAVNVTITSYISEVPQTGESGCTHDCSTCKGCH